MKLVFVSSTFKDMQYERDMLHTHVIPLLDDRLSKYGESSRFGDLRWGVNTTELSEEESSKKVLQVFTVYAIIRAYGMRSVRSTPHNTY